MAHSPDSWSWSSAEEPATGSGRSNSEGQHASAGLGPSNEVQPSSWWWGADSEEKPAPGEWGSGEEGGGVAAADGRTAGGDGPTAGAEPGAAAAATHHLSSCSPGPGGEEEWPDSGCSSSNEGQASNDWDSDGEEISPPQGAGGYNSPEPPALPAHDSATGFTMGGTGGVSDEEGAEEWGAAVPGPLHHAAAAGQLRRVRALLAAGAEVDGQALPDYYTPLHLAASEGHERVVEALLAAGAHPEALALGNRTPLMLAAGRGQAACFQPLLAAGADVQAVDENNLTCLHHWAAWAALHPESDRALQALRALLDAGCDAAWHAPGSRTALDMLLRRHLGYTRAPGLPLTHVPEMVRLLAGAGCPVDADPAADFGAASAMDIWLWGLFPGDAEGCGWPVVLTAETLAVSAELLRCAAPAPWRRGARRMVDAISIGDLRLVRVVLEAFPDCLHRPDPQDNADCPSAVGWACHALYRELPDYDSDWDGLPVPEWDLVTATPVLHGCKLVAALLAAGAQPENLALVEDDYDWDDVDAGEGDPRTASLPEGLVQLRGPIVTLYVPSWALGTLSFLPLMAAGIEWSPQYHALFPPTFRHAAKTLLLINECRWRHGAEMASGGASHAGLAHKHLPAVRRSTALSRLLGRNPQQARPVARPTWLPSHLLHHVLLLASRPLPAWVPELAPFVQQAELE